MFGPLDFIYMPAADVDRAIDYYVNKLGGALIWRIRDGDTIVAHVQISASGPKLILASHLEGDAPIMIYRVDSLTATLTELRARGWQAEKGPFGLPHGPCATFRDPNGQRFAVYQLTRPEVDRDFDGRIDPIESEDLIDGAIEEANR